MLLSHDKKCLFIHIPKNAGTSIQQSLSSPLKDPKIITGIGNEKIFFHSTIRQMYHQYGNCLDSYFKFSIVRNPWDRMWSFYRFTLNRWPDAIEGYDFKKFLLEFSSTMALSHLPDESIIRTQERSQLDWLTDKNGVILVDFIGKYESLNEDFVKICNNLNIINTPLKWIRKVDGEDYRTVYDNETIEFIEKYYKKDIDMFGYRYE